MAIGQALTFAPTTFTLDSPVTLTITGTGFTTWSWVDLADLANTAIQWNPSGGWGNPDPASGGTVMTFTSTPSAAAVMSYGRGPRHDPDPDQSSGVGAVGDLQITVTDYVVIFPYNQRASDEPVVYNPVF